MEGTYVSINNIISDHFECREKLKECISLLIPIITSQVKLKQIKIKKEEQKEELEYVSNMLQSLILESENKEENKPDKIKKLTN